MFALSEALATLVDAMPDPERDVLSRVYWGRESLGSIARDYGMSKRSITRIKERGLQRLREVMT